MTGDEMQHLRTQICTALPDCREVRWRARARMERRRDRQEEAKEKEGENRKSCRYENQEALQNFFLLATAVPTFCCCGMLTLPSPWPPI